MPSTNTETTGHRVEKALALRGISKAAMLKHFGLGINSIKYWQKSGAIPAGKTLYKIADYLDVSLDYLTCRVDCPYIVKDLDDTDLSIVGAFHSLSPDAQTVILNALKLQP